MESDRYQDLASFRVPEGYRGRSIWFVQLWLVFEAIFVRSSPQVLYGWRRFCLRLFGAKIGRDVLIRPGVRVTFPWKVTIGDHCWIGDNVTLYNIAAIKIGDNSVVSQEAYLCTGSHDYHESSFSLVSSPITIEPESWVAARSFIGPGVTIGRGAIVGACSVVLRSVDSGAIVAGVPAKRVGARTPSQVLSGALNSEADIAGRT